MTIHLVSTRRARNTQARDLASPPKKAKKEPKHERQHPTRPKRGIWHRPQKRQQKNPSTKGSTRRARNTQARDLASSPKKAKKKKQTRKAAPDEQETPKRGIWHRPQKRQGSTWLDRGNLDRIWAFWDYKMVFHSA